jgi:hypothetical protein
MDLMMLLGLLSLGGYLLCQDTLLFNASMIWFAAGAVVYELKR